MEVTELYNLTKWVDDQVLSDTHGPLLDNYQHFLNALQNAQSGQPFEIEREKLRGALEEIDFLGLTEHQKLFLEEINVRKCLGQPAIETIEDILTRSGLDLASAHNHIQELFNSLNAGLNKLKQIQEGLKDYITEDEDESEGGVITRLSFYNDTSINNVVDFKKAGKDWDIIGRGIAEICDCKPEDIQIIGASRGSVILDLLLDPPVAIALGGIITFILQSTKTFYQIKKMSAETKAMNLDNEYKAKLSRLLESGIEKEKEKIVNNTVDETIKSFSVNKSKTTEITKAVELLADFLEDGGQIDFVLPPQEETNEDEVSEVQSALLDFREQVKKTKLLSEEVNQLRLPPPENDTEQDDQIDDELEEQSDDDQEQE